MTDLNYLANTLNTILNNINKDSYLKYNNIHINKIVSNMHIIMKLYTYISFNDTYVNYLKNIEIGDYKNLKKKLGCIIYNMYRSSGYNIIMSNIPNEGCLISNNNIELINSETMFDTIEHYMGVDTVDNIFQVTNNTYLIKLKDINNCKLLCNLLNKMQLYNNIIKVEYLDINTLIPILDTREVHTSESTGIYNYIYSKLVCVFNLFTYFK